MEVISKEELLKTFEECNAVSFYELNEHSAEAYYDLRREVESAKPLDVLPRNMFFDFRDKLNKWMFHNCESVCGNNMIDIDYLDAHISELFCELGIIRFDEEGNRID